ncbi:MAG: acetyl-CoA carboxylase biotin carboxylase subunit, partial [Candidatus Eremiobacteraeota bacterium]|nr:acetyl-CoA carboxylase biotin carboxylase subunit [Candidatus Eremiobacteraeota bacterium]
MIRRLLIANRGEIAVRIARGAREMGIEPLGVYSEADRSAMHLDFMAESACIGPAAATESYLNIPSILDAARKLGADAVHPGYGFLSERPQFATAVQEAGLIFVGPSPEAMEAMGSKRRAKALARENGVPVVPGYDGEDQDPERLAAEAKQIGTPLLIKASGGGGGRGMRIVRHLNDFNEALQSARREAKAAFGDDTMLLERYLQRPRHIEFQILADAHGNVVHLGERECSIQRRHQKIIEEAPSSAMSSELRATMGEAAVRIARAVQYVNAGTLEFMLDADENFYFLEMNTRLQVEHPVTEAVYDVDLVHWQLRIANGERLTLKQERVATRVSAVEARIYAEDPYNQMLPSTGTISLWQPAAGPGVRVDSGVQTGSNVSMYYDPMLAKLIVWGGDRATAIRRMQYALESFSVAGVQTNIPLLSWIACNKAFVSGNTTTSFLDEELPDDVFAKPKPSSIEILALA